MQYALKYYSDSFYYACVRSLAGKCTVQSAALFLVEARRSEKEGQDAELGHDRRRRRDSRERDDVYAQPFLNSTTKKRANE